MQPLGLGMPPMSDATRIRLLNALRERELSVQELYEAVGTTQQNVSKHLGVLRRAGIVRRRRQGGFAYHSVADPGIYALCELVCGALVQQVEALRAVVGAPGPAAGR